MTAMNIVRIRVKPAHEKEFLELQKSRSLDGLDGYRAMRIVRTGEREYVLIGEWDSMDALAAARPKMVAVLDQMRGWLEDLGGGLGVTDPRSGEVALERRA